MGPARVRAAKMEWTNTMTWHINSDKSAAVSDTYVWLPINRCPHNVKVLLLTAGDTCVVGHYYGQVGYKFWAPLPKKTSADSELLKAHEERMRALREMSDD